MPSGRRVFVSHSSHEPFADKVRQGVCDRLREKGYEVLVDAEGLKPGQHWRSVLNHWLADCHAAVLLLSREALTSAWVHREASILLWRRALGSEVVIVPALVGDLGPADVAAAGLDELDAFQFAGADSAGADAADVDELVASITEQLADIPASHRDDADLMRQWIDRISFFLGKVGDPEQLSRCAHELGVAAEDLHHVRLAEGHRFLAHQLLDDGLSRRVYRAVRTICDFMGREWLDRLVNDVAFTWVNRDAARDLLAASMAANPSVALLNAFSPATADEYLDRATCRAEYWREVAGTVVGEEPVAELVAHYEQAVASLHGVEAPWTAADIQPRDTPSFLVIDPAGNRPESVSEALRIIHGRYPWVVLLVLAGRDDADDLLPGWALGPVHTIAPALGPGEELAARRTVRDLRQLIAR